jgi:serine O-acetyltransferase
LFNGVTLGARTLRQLDRTRETGARYPTLGDGVTVFAGAKVLGAVHIGANSVVGANAVVNRSFPENSVVAGIPARLVNTVAPGTGS